MTRLLSTREVADLLGIHEKKVYKLITEQNLPATKVTGKWLFPSHLVEQWIENNTVNYPGQKDYLLRTPALFVVAGSNDVLLDRTITLFMRQFPEYVAVFGNLGSLGGLKVLRQGLCHIAASHLAEEDSRDYNFAHAAREMDRIPAVVNFCRREQGIILPPGNPRNIASVRDLADKGVRVVNRALGTGTRLWFDRELEKTGVATSKLDGYDREVQRHLDVGLEVLSGRAGAGPGIRAVADRMGLDFLPMHWERFDLLIAKERFFDRNIQSFLGLLHDGEFRKLADELEGYDLTQCGKMVYPSKEL
jgi:excisionase family DNA binding protein